MMKYYMYYFLKPTKVLLCRARESTKSMETVEVQKVWLLTQVVPLIVKTIDGIGVPEREFGSLRRGDEAREESSDMRVGLPFTSVTDTTHHPGRGSVRVHVGEPFKERGPLYNTMTLIWRPVEGEVFVQVE